MKNALTLIIATTLLAACSAEVKSEAPSLPAVPSFGQPSPAQQELKVGSSELVFNDIITVGSSDVQKFTFNYTAPDNGKLYIDQAGLAAMDCELSNVVDKVFFENANGPTSTMEVTPGASHSVIKNQKYVIRVEISGTKGCGSISFSFGTRFEIQKDVLAGSQNLVLNQGIQKSVPYPLPSENFYYEYNFVSTYDRKLYFAYFSDSTSSQCQGKIEKEWITKDASGSITASQTLNDFSDFMALANKSHSLRIKFVNMKGQCDFTSVSFSVAPW